jgi:hypothetical protein
VDIRKEVNPTAKRSTSERRESAAAKRTGVTRFLTSGMTGGADVRSAGTSTSPIRPVTV